ncbi:cytoplasmic tRNA 2-thiolation protein [Blastocystis sp. subtype 4]|uniref:cytoplasmic tRNA 2-thiolation protein n=1 Tax=Blastocystis sp. subtype 4 TaxID=944170 RepID=UPI0007120363|nr:cytoplasmic tRNA 2-thiolation protein [Blastocystis sp. subtype 4]KNB43454.1 cytoplasmic tRNA 2-thiolation protein [Blastocystis sp. subtype 4]|eukprot:XP_014526897.1 cytoplasmic tRNA 2-thiolation protein [Blastocystis sp. subtype 4]
MFETEVHETIIKEEMFKRGQRIAIGASGGKDSTTLAYVLASLNKRYDYGLDLFLLSIDEGIVGYRDGSLETVKQNAIDYQLPLQIYSYKELFGYTMDEIVQQTCDSTGFTKACSYCGVFRRQALNIGAKRSKADLIATGHNADDNAETGKIY